MTEPEVPPQPRRVVRLLRRGDLTLEAFVDLEAGRAVLTYQIRIGQRVAELAPEDAAILAAVTRREPGEPDVATVLKPRSKPRERLLTVAEIATYLRLGHGNAYRAARGMRHVKVGARVLVPESALDEYLAARARAPETWPPPPAPAVVVGERPRRSKTATAAGGGATPALRLTYPRTKPRPR